MTDEIPPEWRLSENMDLEYETMLGSGTTELPVYLRNKMIQQPVNITEVPDYYTLNAKYFINNGYSKYDWIFIKVKLKVISYCFDAACLELCVCVDFNEVL